MIETRSEDLITNVISSFIRENERLAEGLIQIQYFMRGALDRDAVWQLTPVEREKYVDFLNKRFKDVGDIMKKGGTAFV